MTFSIPKGIVPPQALVGLPYEAILPIYGSESARYPALLRVQSESPIPIDVPSARLIPSRSNGEFSNADIRAAFEDLTRGISDRHVLAMKRSAVREGLSGSDSRLFVTFDRSDREGSFRRFADSIDALLQSSLEAGVLANVAVGGVTVYDGHLFRRMMDTHFGA